MAHQVAGIFVGRVNFDLHDGLEQRGTGLLHGFFEGEGAGDFEGHIAGIDIVIFAVVKDDAEIDDGKAGEEAAFGGIAHTFFHRGNPIAGNRAAENIVDKFNSLPARKRFELDAAKAELAVAAGLLFVFAFGVGFGANGFAVSDLRRMDDQFHVITLA